MGGRGERPLFEAVGWGGMASEGEEVTAPNLSSASWSFRFSSAISSSISCGCATSLLALLSAINCIREIERIDVLCERRQVLDPYLYPYHGKIN